MEVLGQGQGSTAMTIRATWNGTVVVEGNHYFPIGDVRREFLEETETQTTCSWKGKASYYAVVVDGRRNVDAVWYYASPLEAASDITGRLAFWRGIDVAEVDTGGNSAPGWRKRIRRSG